MREDRYLLGHSDGPGSPVSGKGRGVFPLTIREASNCKHNIPGKKPIIYELVPVKLDKEA